MIVPIGGLIMDREAEWRCPKCRTILGVQRGERLYVRFKKFQYLFVGTHDTVIATCGNCSLTDERPEVPGAAASIRVR